MSRRWIRIRKLRLPALVLAMLAVWAAAAAASTVQIAGVDTSSYPEVRVTVVAPAGSREPSLRQNGAAVSDVQAVDLGSDKSIVLAVDRSQSMRGASLTNAIAAAATFVSVKRPGDRIEVVVFGKHAQVVSGFTTSAGATYAALGSIRADPQAGTALWDAVRLASGQLAGQTHRGHVVVLLTDGQDVSSSATFGGAVAAAQKAKAAVYTIGIAGPDFTPAPLRTLAARTGGSFHEASSTARLLPIYAAVSSALSRTWQLSYATTARPGDRLDLSAWVPNAARATDAVTVPGSPPKTASPQLLPKSAWQASWMPLALAGVVGLLFLLAASLALAGPRGAWVKQRLEPHLGQVRRATRTRGRKQHAFVHNIVSATERTLANVKQFRALQRLLERADVPLRAGELVYICIFSGLGLGVLFFFATGSAVVGLLVTAFGGWLPILFIRFKANRRVKAFDNQLPDLLITISASLKAGHSFRQAIQAVVEEGAQPSAGEFSRVLSETQLGRPMELALADMASRVGSKNLNFVITAVTIQRQVGGSLAGLFDMVAETVRQRQQFTRKVRGLTAMGRISAYVLMALPFFIAITVTALNPTYMAPLYNTSVGHMLIAIALGMMAFGSLILRRMVAFAH